MAHELSVTPVAFTTQSSSANDNSSRSTFAPNLQMNEIEPTARRQSERSIRSLLPLITAETTSVLSPTFCRPPDTDGCGTSAPQSASSFLRVTAAKRSEHACAKYWLSVLLSIQRNKTYCFLFFNTRIS